MTWNSEAAELLRSACGLDGQELRRALAWWRRLRKGSEERAPVSDSDIKAAILGLPLVHRVNPPWEPYRMFKNANLGMFPEAVSAYYKSQTKGPTRLGEIMERIR